MPFNSEAAVIRAFVAALSGANYQPHVQQKHQEQHRQEGFEQQGGVIPSTHSNQQQRQSMEAWPAHLHRLEPTSDFFRDAGGNSLAAAAAAAHLGIDLRLVYAYPTARSLAAALRNPRAEAPAAAKAAAAAGGGAAVRGGADQDLKQVPPAAAAAAAPIEAVPGSGNEVSWKSPADRVTLVIPAAISTTVTTAENLSAVALAAVRSEGAQDSDKAEVGPGSVASGAMREEDQLMRPLKRFKADGSISLDARKQHQQLQQQHHHEHEPKQQQQQGELQKHADHSVKGRLAWLSAGSTSWQWMQHSSYIPSAFITKAATGALNTGEQREGGTSAASGAAAAKAAATTPVAAAAPADTAQAEAAPGVGSVGFQLKWRLHLGQCVDAAPLLAHVVTTGFAINNGKSRGEVRLGEAGMGGAAPAKVQEIQQEQWQQQRRQPQDQRGQGASVLVAFGCSHNGQVVCVAVEGGCCLWRCQLPGRADAGMVLGMGPAIAPAAGGAATAAGGFSAAATAAIVVDAAASSCRDAAVLSCSHSSDNVTPILATNSTRSSRPSSSISREDTASMHKAFLGVASGKGYLYCLDPWTGAVQGEALCCGGEVKAAPVADPWWGHWWLVTHGRELLVVTPGQQLQVQARCGWGQD